MHLSRRTHGLLDYLLGVLIMASPWLFGFSGQRAAPQLALALGGALLLVSALSNYEMGLVPLIPFPGQRFFDCVIGIALAGASWHFDMNGIAAAVFTTLGLGLLLSAVFTRFPRDTGMVESR
jgi:hypothetical protein